MPSCLLVLLLQRLGALMLTSNGGNAGWDG